MSKYNAIRFVRRRRHYATAEKTAGSLIGHRKAFVGLRATMKMKEDDENDSLRIREYLISSTPRFRVAFNVRSCDSFGNVTTR